MIKIIALAIFILSYPLVFIFGFHNNKLGLVLVMIIMFYFGYKGMTKGE